MFVLVSDNILNFQFFISPHFQFLFYYCLDTLKNLNLQSYIILIEQRIQFRLLIIKIAKYKQFTEEQKQQVIGLNVKETNITEKQLIKFALQFVNLEVLLSDIYLSDESIEQLANLNNIICINEITLDTDLDVNQLLKQPKYKMLQTPFEIENQNEQHNYPNTQEQDDKYIQQQLELQQYTWLTLDKQLVQKYVFNYLPETIEYIKIKNYTIGQQIIKENKYVQYMDITAANKDSQTDNICQFLSQFTNLKILLASQFQLTNSFINEAINRNIKIFVKQSEQKQYQEKLSLLYTDQYDFKAVIDKYLVKYEEQCQIQNQSEIQNLNSQKIYDLTLEFQVQNIENLIENLKKIKFSAIKFKFQENQMKFENLIQICESHKEVKQIESSLDLTIEEMRILKSFGILRYNNKILGFQYFGTFCTENQKIKNQSEKTLKIEEKNENSNENFTKNQNLNLNVSELTNNREIQINKNEVDEIIDDLENQEAEIQQNSIKIEKTLYNDEVLKTQFQFQFIEPQKIQIFNEEELQMETEAIMSQFNQEIGYLLDKNQKQSIPNIEELIKKNIEKIRDQQVETEKLLNKCDLNMFYQTQSIQEQVDETQTLFLALKKVNSHHQKFIDYMNDYKQDLENLNDKIHNTGKNEVQDLEKQILVAQNTLNELSEYGLNVSTINNDIKDFYMKSASKLKNIQQQIYLNLYKRQTEAYVNNVYHTKRIEPDDYVQLINQKEPAYINEFSKNQVIQIFINAVSQFQKIQQQNTVAQVNFYHYFNNTYFTTKFGSHFAEIRRNKYYNALKIYWNESNIIKCISNTLKYNTFNFFNLCYVNLQTVIYQLLTATIMEQEQNLIEEEIFKIVDSMKINGVDGTYAVSVVNTLKEILSEEEQNQIEIILNEKNKIDWIELVAIAMIIKAQKEKVWESE